MANTDIGKIARNFIRQFSVGVLATHSLDLAGYPFGSAIPYAINNEGEPIILISKLAQHTRNILVDKKVSLTVFDPKTVDIQTSGWLAWLGEATPLASEDQAAKDRYLRYFPNAASFFQLGDFQLYKISVTRVRYIAGFGQIYWVEPANILLKNPLQNVETSIIDHMNTDHVHTMREYCQGLKGIECLDVHMLGIDSEGFDLMVDKHKVRFIFENEVFTAEEARTALVNLARKSRSNMPTIKIPSLNNPQ